MKRIAIIGSGIAGLTVGMKLVEKGAHVSIFECSALSPASRAALGIVSQKGLFLGRNPNFAYQLRGGKYLKEDFLIQLQKKTGISVPHISGISEPFDSLEHYRAQRERAYHHSPSGIFGSEVYFKDLPSPDRIKNLWQSQILNATGVIHHPNDGWVCPRSLIDALRVFLASKSQGVFDVEVKAVMPEGVSGVRLETAERSYFFEGVVLCAGWKSIDLLPGWKGNKSRFGAKLKPGVICQSNQSGFNLALKRGRNSFVRANGQCIFGPYLGLNVQKIGSEISDKFLLTSLMNFGSKWAFLKGRRLMLKDRLPVVGALSDQTPSIYCNFGYYKNGFYLAPYLAQWISEEILYNKKISFLNEYRIGRF